MKIVLIIIAVFAVIFILYILALHGRKNHPHLPEMGKWSYAHRGLHDKPGIPENSLAAFRRALHKDYGAELDVHLLRDGGLAVMHDSSLKRTTGAEGRIEDLTVPMLSGYNLEGTTETIPQLCEVLELFNGKAPLIVELKPADGNHKTLCEAVFKLLDNYKGFYVVESFDPRCVLWLKKHRPHVIRGQLAHDFIKEKSGMCGAVDVILTALMANFLTRPDFIAYKFEDRKHLGNILCLKLWKLQGASWTIRTKEDYDTAVSEGLVPIFENFEP